MTACEFKTTNADSALIYVKDTSGKVDNRVTDTHGSLPESIQGEISDTVHSYFLALNQKDLPLYNDTVSEKLTMDESSASWQYFLKTYEGNKNTEIDFSTARMEKDVYIVPVTYSVTMSDDYIPSDLNPGENVVWIELHMKKSSNGKMLINEWGISSVLKDKEHS